MNSRLDNFTDLLIEISNEVLINRPFYVSRFISRMLEAYLDRRTLWQLQMAAYNMEEAGLLKVIDISQNNSSLPESNVRLSSKVKGYKERVAERRKSSNHSQSSSHCKFIARNSYLSHLAEKGAQGGAGKETSSDIDADTLTSGNTLKPNTTMPQTSNNTPNETGTKSFCTSDRVRRRATDPPSSKQPDIKEIKGKLRSCSAELNNEEIVYEQVLNSINVLIDIEKETKHESKDLQVFNVLRNGSEKLASGLDEGSGIEESPCLKPSVFRRFDTRVVGKSGGEWNVKLRKLKAYNNSHSTSNISNTTPNSTRAPNVSGKIANFSRLGNSSTKTPPNGQSFLFPKIHFHKTPKHHASVEKKSISRMKHSTAQPFSSPFSPATFSSPFTPLPAPPSPLPAPHKTSIQGIPKETLELTLSPVQEAPSSSNISSEFEFNKQLINSSVECLLDPTKVKLDDDINPIAYENDTLLRKLALPLSSSSSLSSIIGEDELCKGRMEKGWKEGETEGELQISRATMLHEVPETLNLLPTLTEADMRVARFLTPKRKVKVTREPTRTCSDSKMKKVSWREYQLRGTSESAQDLVLEEAEEEDLMVWNETAMEEVGGMKDVAEMVRASSDSHLESITSPSQTNLPSFPSNLFSTDCKAHACTATSSSSTHKLTEGLQESALEASRQFQTTDYYRTTWIANSNSSLGFLDDSIRLADSFSDCKNSQQNVVNNPWCNDLTNSQQQTVTEELRKGCFEDSSSLPEPPMMGERGGLVGERGGLVEQEDCHHLLIDLCCEGLADTRKPPELLFNPIDDLFSTLTGLEESQHARQDHSMQHTGESNDGLCCEASGKRKERPKERREKPKERRERPKERRERPKERREKHKGIGKHKLCVELDEGAKEVHDCVGVVDGGACMEGVDEEELLETEV